MLCSRLSRCPSVSSLVSCHSLRTIVSAAQHVPQQEWLLTQHGKDWSNVCLADCERRLKRATDVLIRVHAASINPIDLEQADGFGHTVFDLMRRMSGEQEDLPLCLGRDFAGVVQAKGAAVRNLRIGDEVIGVLSPEVRHGSHATHVVADSSLVVLKPDNVSHAEGAAVPYAGLTALSAVCIYAGLNSHNSRFKRVLVLGGSGSVGIAAIAILKSFGADVTATCSADAKEWLRSVTPVDDVIDYNDVAEFATHSNKYDLVLNAAPMSAGVLHEQALTCLKRDSCAQYVSLTQPVLRNTDRQGLLLGTLTSACDLVSQNVRLMREGILVKWAFVVPSRGGLQCLADMVQEKRLEPVVQHVFPFREVRLAYESAGKGHARGKTVINMTA